MDWEMDGFSLASVRRSSDGNLVVCARAHFYCGTGVKGLEQSSPLNHLRYIVLSSSETTLLYSMRSVS